MSLALLSPAHPAKVGGLFDQIANYLNLGLQGYAAVQSVTGAGAGGGTGQAKGLAAITAASAQVLQGLDQMLAAARQSPQNANAILPQAEQLAATLGNSAYFYQAKKGQDAQVLSAAKTSAAEKISAIRALVGGGGSQTLITQNPQTGALTTTPATITSVGGQSGGGGGINIDTNTLMLGGGALLVLYLLKRK